MEEVQLGFLDVGEGRLRHPIRGRRTRCSAWTTPPLVGIDGAEAADGAVFNGAQGDLIRCQSHSFE